MKSEQMGLIGFVDESLNTVFGAKAIKNKDGVVVGTAVAMAGRKDVALAMGLKANKENKDAIDSRIEEQGIAAFRKVRGEVNSLVEAGWSLKRTASRTMGDGLRQITVVIKEVKKSGPSDEAIAKSLGISVEEVVEMRERQKAKLAEDNAKTIDVPALDNQKGEMTAAPKAE
jgi:hypothetical protein